MENQVRLYQLASVRRWTLKAVYFLEHTEYDRGKLKHGLPLFIRFSATLIMYYFYQLHLFYWSGLIPESCLYFPGLRGSKLLNGCLLVRARNLCLRGMQ